MVPTFLDSHNLLTFPWLENAFPFSQVVQSEWEPRYIQINNRIAMPSLMRITFTKNKGLIHTLSSHSKGKCNTISNGSASAANTINSDMPLFKVFVAEKDDNFGCNVQTLFHWGRVPQLKKCFRCNFGHLWVTLYLIGTIVKKEDLWRCKGLLQYYYVAKSCNMWG